jgi:uncharacterized lipoprotein YajG
MKRIITALAAVAALFLAGCATDMSRYYAVQEKAVEADNNAVMALAAAAASGNQGAIVALALRQNSGAKIAPPQDKALQWASILVPGLTNIYGINRNAAISMKQIDAEVQMYTGTLDAVGSIAGQGIDAAAKDPLVIQPTIVHVPAGGSVTSP